jgi:hypothetical protein
MPKLTRATVLKRNHHDYRTRKQWITYLKKMDIVEITFWAGKEDRMIQTNIVKQDDGSFQIFWPSEKNWNRKELFEETEKHFNASNFLSFDFTYKEGGRTKSRSIKWTNMDDYAEAKEFLKLPISRLNFKICNKYVERMDHVINYFKKSGVEEKQEFAEKVQEKQTKIEDMCLTPQHQGKRIIPILHEQIEMELKRSRTRSKPKGIPGAKE